MKILYFKVFASRNEIKGYNYFIETPEKCIELCNDLKNDIYEKPYILEPIFMTEKAFNKLPEFTGF